MLVKLGDRTLLLSLKERGTQELQNKVFVDEISSSGFDDKKKDRCVLRVFVPLVIDGQTVSRGLRFVRSLFAPHEIENDASLLGARSTIEYAV